MHHTSTVAAALEHKPRKGLIVRDESKQQFITFDSYDIFESWYKYIDIKTHHEVITGNQKLRFDIDGDKKAHEIFNNTLDHFTPTKTVWDEFIDILGSIFITEYDIELPKESIIVCDSSDENKFSRHIIINGFYVSDHKEANRFAKKFYEGWPEYIQTYIDKGIYKSTQNFRIAGSHKVGSNRVKKILTKHSLADTMITNIDGCIKLETTTIVVEDKPVHAHVEERYMKEAANLAAPFMDGFKLAKVVNNILYYDRIKSTSCKVCRRVHDSVGCNIVVKRDNNNISLFLNCYRNHHGSLLTSKTVDNTLLTRWVESLIHLPEFKDARNRMIRSDLNSEEFYMSILKELAIYKKKYKLIAKH